MLKNGFSVTGSGCTVRRMKVLEGFFFKNYATAFVKGNMALGFANTLIIVVFAGLGTVLTGSMTAFVLSRFRFKLKKVIYTMFLWIALIPTITTQVATFQIIQKLGMYNTRLSVIVLSMGTDIIAIMIYLQFLNNISVSLDESAIMDGANYWQVFTRIIFPLLQPATVTILILKIVNLYNDFYNPLLYMPKKSLMVISTSLYKFKGPFGTNWPVICAGVVIALIPTLVVFVSMQKYIYSGMVSGSVKE
ncbi:MAG: carbohydrate ABC transporter permease [Treponema sp.]|nr:carbohydrate ABC transporter permease [Treponema sp.]